MALVGIIRQVVETAQAVIDTIPDLVLSPAAVNARNTPNTTAERVYSLTMQTANSGKFRDGSPGHMRYEHTLTVGLMCRILPLNQLSGYNNAIDVEESVILIMLDQANFPSYRVLYDRSRRTLSNSGEYVITEIDFSIEQSAVI